MKIPKYITGPYEGGTENFTIVDQERTEILGPVSLDLHYGLSPCSVAWAFKLPFYKFKVKL